MKCVGSCSGFVLVLFYFFFLALFTDEKRGKSHIRERSPLLYISSRVHELVAGSNAWRVRAVKRQCKSRRFHVLRNLSHTTRANISHEKAEQIRARIVCTPAESAWRGLTHMRSMCVGVAETGAEGGAGYRDG